MVSFLMASAKWLVGLLWGPWRTTAVVVPALLHCPLSLPWFIRTPQHHGQDKNDVHLLGSTAGKVTCSHHTLSCSPHTEKVSALSCAVLEGKCLWCTETGLTLLNAYCLGFFLYSGVLELICWAHWLPQRYSCQWVVVQVDDIWGKTVRNSYSDIFLRSLSLRVHVSNFKNSVLHIVGAQ